MRTRTFASTGKSMGAIGLGCMGMSWGYAESQRDDEASVDVVRTALDAGVTMIDTADIYGDGHNERLVGRALAGRREEAFVATKGGLVVDDLPTKQMHRDGSPEHVRSAVRRSLQRLDVEVIDLYYLHRVDPDVPLTETWGAMSEMVQAGLVRHLGLSEVDVDQAAEAHAVHPVSAVQSELSLWTRDALGADSSGAGPTSVVSPAKPSGDVVAWCAAHGAAFVPFAPLGRGFLTGTMTAPDFESDDFRATNPRFTRDAMALNGRIVDVVRAVAARHVATPAQVAIAWTLAQGDHVLPIPGTRRRSHLDDNLAAADLRLDVADLRLLDEAPATVGSRY